MNNKTDLSAFLSYFKTGVLDRKNSDQGDSLHGTSIYYSLLMLLKKDRDHDQVETRLGLLNALKLLKRGKGVYSRSNIPEYWGYNPNNCSRDQLIMCTLAYAIASNHDELKEIIQARFKRFGFHQNIHIGTDVDLNDSWFGHKIPDVTYPQELSIWIRGLDLWYLWPVLLILDLAYTVDIFVTHKWDFQMLVPQIAYSQIKYSTPISLLNRILLKRTDWFKSIEAYWSETYPINGCLPMIDLYKELKDEIIDR